MRVGIGSWTYGWAIGVRGYPAPAQPMTAMDLLKAARAFGLGLVQIADNLPLHNLPPAELAELKAQAAEWGITFEIGTNSVRPEHLMKYLELAQYLGAKLVRSLLADIASRPNLTDAANWIREVLPAYEAAGVCLALENYEKYTSPELAGLCRTINSPCVGVCLDTVNSLGALETPAMVLKELAPYVRNLHIKDFDLVRTESRMGYNVVGRPAGEGLLNVDWVLEQLRAAGSFPNIILELWTPYMGSVEETISLERTWAEKSVQFLKRYQG